MPPYPRAPLLRSLLVAPPAVTAARAGQGMLSALTWTIVPVLSVLQDTIEGSGALGWQLAGQKVSAAPAAAAVPAAGGILVQPAAAAVVLTINLPLSATYSFTLLKQQIPFISVLANLVGLSGILVVYGVAFGYFEGVSRHFLGRRDGAGVKPLLSGAAAAGDGGGGAVPPAPLQTEAFDEAANQSPLPLRIDGAGLSAGAKATPNPLTASRLARSVSGVWEREKDANGDFWYYNTSTGATSGDAPEGETFVG